MNMGTVTVQDCIDMYEKKSMCVIINDGNVTGFEKEDSTTRLLLS